MNSISTQVAPSPNVESNDLKSGAATTGGTNLVPTSHSVCPAERAVANQHPSGVLWFTGLPGAGKSTLAMAMQRRLFESGRQAYVIDGDNLRGGLNSDLGFAAADRSENIRRAAELALLMADAGLIVIVALISPYREDRRIAQEIVGDGFVEVFIDADLETCERRDPKGHYARARAGEIPGFTGIDAPYEAPDRPGLVVNTATRTVEEALGELMGFVDRVFDSGSNGKFESRPVAGTSPFRSLAKTLSWRVIATTDTFLIGFLITNSFVWAGSIAGLEVATKTGLYYLHERTWARIGWGHRRSPAKMVQPSFGP